MQFFFSGRRELSRNSSAAQLVSSTVIPLGLGTQKSSIQDGAAGDFPFEGLMVDPIWIVLPGYARYMPGILVYLMFLDWNMNMSAALFTDLGDTRWYKYLVKRSPKIKRSHHNRQLFEKSEYDLRSVEIFSSYGISRYITVYTSLLWTLWWPCVHNHVTILVAPVGGFTAT